MNRNDFLNQNLSGLLGRLSPPMAIKKNEDAQKQEIRLLLKAVTDAAPGTNLADWWADFEETLLGSLNTRAWPTLAETHKALRKCRVYNDKTEADFDLARKRAVLDWAQEHGKPHPAWNNPGLTAMLIDNGVLADLRHARFRGFDLTTEQNAEAKRMRPTREEFNRHCEVMAKIRRTSFEDEIVAARNELSEVDLPEEFARGSL
jgi:hypothetical protein